MIKVINLSIIIFSVFLNAGAQLFLKAGMTRVGVITASSFKNIFPIAKQVFLNPFILGGLACYAVSLVVWMGVLSRVEVNYAYPMLSIGYIVTAICGALFFSEPLTLIRVIGIVVIMLGVVLINR